MTWSLLGYIGNLVSFAKFSHAPKKKKKKKFIQKEITKKTDHQKIIIKKKKSVELRDDLIPLRGT